MDTLNNRNRLLNRYFTLGLIQMLSFVLYFYLIITGRQFFAYLLPLFFINLCMYPMLISYPQRMFIFFLIMLPFSAIGLFPTFYREIFLYFIPIFGIFFLYITHFINKEEKFQIVTHPISRYVVFLICALFISFIHAVLRGWFSRALLRHSYLLFQAIILLVIIMNLLKEKQELLKAIRFLFFSSAAANLLFLILRMAQGVLLERRVITPFLVFGINDIAMLFGPYIVLGTSLFWMNNSLREKLFILISIIIMVVILVITQSRGGWFGVFCATTYIFVKKKSYRGMFILAIFLLLLLSFQLLRGIVTARVAQIGGGDLALWQRLFLWRTAGQMIAENFLFGVGMDNFRHIKYQFGYPLWLDPNKSFNTHNIYLEILVNLGILGFISFFGLIIKTITNLSKTISLSQDKDLATVALGLKAATLAFLIHGVVDSGLFRNVIFFGLVILLGFSWTIIKLNNSSYKVENKDSNVIAK